MIKEKSCNWQFVKKKFFSGDIFVIGRVRGNKQFFMVGLIIVTSDTSPTSNRLHDIHLAAFVENDTF